MAENNITGYIDTLGQVLLARKEWLEHYELVRLKDNLRAFQSSFSSLFNIYLKKKLIDEDPYKQEAKITELEVPDSNPFQDAKRIEQLSLRLANYDNQLDFLVNFYQLGIDFLNLERIKRILGLVRYIEWGNLSSDSQSLMTAAIADLTNHAKQGVDHLTMSIISGGLSRLSKSTAEIMSILKNLNLYYRESYKLSVRQNITKDMSESEATLENIKKKIAQLMPGSPFYRELMEEIIKEDYSSRSVDIRDNVLNSLRVAIEKPKSAKPMVDYKKILLDGIQVIGGASNPLAEICFKLDENQEVMVSGKKGFLFVLRELIRQITRAEPEEVVFDIEYIDSTSGAKVKEKINFHQFREDLNKKIRILSSFVRGPAYQKISAMTEEQIIGHLERNIREVQALHKTLNALDDHFKTSVTAEDREKIKGIKPELSALKNTIVKANQLRYEYSAQKEQEDQMKRLGLAPGTIPVTAPISTSDKSPDSAGNPL
ncbi:MAG: hypothetical protein LBU88_08880 [Treponema sp.]|jgi:hypothetical protein|nr:hypothetical protein [Treponema sp.]